MVVTLNSIKLASIFAFNMIAFKDIVDLILKYLCLFLIMIIVTVHLLVHFIFNGIPLFSFSHKLLIHYSGPTVAIPGK